jgi:hypothetical protein
MHPFARYALRPAMVLVLASLTQARADLFTFETIDFPEVPNTQEFGIDDAGQIVGSFLTASGHQPSGECRTPECIGSNPQRLNFSTCIS